MLEVKLTKRRTVAAGTTELILTLPSGADFNFEAGQHLELILPAPKYQDDLGSRRFFSIASSPNRRPELRLAYRDSPSAFKRTLAELPLGAPLQIDGPFGSFTLFEPTDEAGGPETQPMLFVAGGIGITPFLSLLEALAANKSPRPVTLLYANQTPESAAYLSELKSLLAQLPNGKLIEHYGKLESGAFQFLISNLPDGKAGFQIPKASCFIAGPAAMNAVAFGALQKLGVPRQNLLLEDFSGY